jgi:hypothetical protein
MVQKRASESYLNKSLKFADGTVAPQRATNFIYFDIDSMTSQGTRFPLSTKDERRIPWNDILDARVLETSLCFYKCLITKSNFTKFVAWVPAFLVVGVDD